MVEEENRVLKVALLSPHLYGGNIFPGPTYKMKKNIVKVVKMYSIKTDKIPVIVIRVKSDHTMKWFLHM